MTIQNSAKAINKEHAPFQQGFPNRDLANVLDGACMACIYPLKTSDKDTVLVSQKLVGERDK